jgi:ABC-type branched-subunit amino acid transport system substrate-binding protein
VGVGLAFALLASACGPRFEAAEAVRLQDGSQSGPGSTDGSTDGFPSDGDLGPAGGTTTGGRGRTSTTTTGGGGAGGTASTRLDNGGATDVGITATSVTIGGSIAVGGPLPGQFLPGAEGLTAYVRTLNEQGGVYGRQLLYHYHDDALNRDTFRSNMAHLIGEDKVFALVGSLSAADDGACGHIGKVPDIGTFALSYCRGQAPNHYGPMGSLKQNIYGCCAEWGWLRDQFGYTTPAAQYLTDLPISQNQGLAVVDGLVRTLKLRSRNDVHQGAQRATQPDYNGEVLRMQGNDVDAVFSSMDLPSNVRMLRAMCQQGFRPKVVHLEISTYDASFFQRVGANCIESQNVYIRTPHLPFQRTDNAEMRAYLSAMKRYFPDSRPSTFGIEGWLAGKLFAEGLRSAGPRATRAKLYTALDGIQDWTGGGLKGPTTPSERTIYHCNIMLHLETGDFAAKTDFLCGNFYRSEDFTGPAVGP